MDERRDMSKIYERLDAHGQRLAALETNTTGMDKKLDRVLEKLSDTREQVAEGKGKMAVIWTGVMAGFGALGHAIFTTFQGKGQ